MSPERWCGIERSDPHFSSPHAALDSALQALAEKEFQGKIVGFPWFCDVKAANADVILAHNQAALARGEAIEPKFANVVGTPSLLRDLLWQDFDYLCNCVPWLARDRDQFDFVDIFGAVPDAEILSAIVNGKPLHLIGFRAPLLHFMHAAYSKIYILSSLFLTADCLPQHARIMNRDEYADVALAAGFYNDIEMLFDLKRLEIPIHPPHWADPYDYCGRVEETRRFLLGHEIGHALWHDCDRSELRHEFTSRGMNDSQALAWAEELWCDTVSIGMLLNQYNDVPLTGNDLFRAEDLLIGVFTFMKLFGLVELILDKKNVIPKTHPPMIVRERNLWATLCMHPVFRSSPELEETLRRNLKSLSGFCRGIAGVDLEFGTPLTLQNRAFRRLLTEFGIEAFRTIARHYECDPEALRQIYIDNYDHLPGPQ